MFVDFTRASTNSFSINSKKLSLAKLHVLNLPMSSEEKKKSQLYKNVFIKNELITKILNTKTQVFYYKLKLHQFPTIHKKVYKKIIKFLKMLLKVFCLKHYLFISDYFFETF